MLSESFISFIPTHNLDLTTTMLLSKTIKIALLSFIILCGFLFYFYQKYNTYTELPVLEQATWLPDFAPHPYFELTQGNSPFSSKDFMHKWSFVYFGYTACPDICPTTMAILHNMSRNLAKIDHAPKNIQIVLISVDPKRDTPQKLATYAQAFGENVIGVTGEQSVITDVVNSFGAVYAFPQGTEINNYLVDHSSFIYLVAPDGRMVAQFPPPQQTSSMVSDFLTIQQSYHLPLK